MPRLALCLLLASACGGPHVLSPDDTVLIDGTVSDASGKPLASATVTLERTPEALAARTVLPCWPEATYEALQTSTSDAQGRFSFRLPVRDARFASGASRCLRVGQSTTDHAVHAAFDVRAQENHLLDLPLREVSLHATGALSWAWAPPADPLDGQSALLFTGDGWPVWRADGVQSQAALDDALAEDAARVVRWLGVRAAPLNGGTATLSWTQDLSIAAPTRRAVSRGAACDAPAASLGSPCPLTDGLFRDPLADSAIGWVAVRLPQPSAISRVVLHNLMADARSVRVEGSADGTTWSTLAETSLGGGYPWFLDVRFAAAQVAAVRVVPLDAKQGTPAIRALSQVSLF